MSEEIPSSEDKKIQIKPRRLKSSPNDEKLGEVAGEQKSPNKPGVRPKPIGVPFEARAQSRPISIEKVLEGDPPGEKKSEGTEAELSASPPALAGKEPPLPAKPVFQMRQWIKKSLRKRVPVWQFLLVFAPVAVVIAWIFFSAGAALQHNHMVGEIAKQGVNIPGDFQARLDKALMELRTGDARKALDQLALLEQETPAVSSLSYLVALAAMQAGDPETASGNADQSIAKRERVSDSLALKAVLETQKPKGSATTFGDPRLRAESYLRQAMIADAANPSPYVELATLLRYRNQNEEAMQLLQGARSRLNPVDSHSVVDVSIALLKMQNLPDNELPENINPDNDVASLFSASYLAMRKGDFARAASHLKTCRQRLPTDLYYYLVNDPALRKFARQPELAEFF